MQPWGTPLLTQHAAGVTYVLGLDRSIFLLKQRSDAEAIIFLAWKTAGGVPVALKAEWLMCRPLRGALLCKSSGHLVTPRAFGAQRGGFLNAPGFLGTTARRRNSIMLLLIS